MNGYFAYIRVSTVKQGERGSSLQEQRSAIEAYASRHGLVITQWFEEMETAAKQGRRLFVRMVSDLQGRKAKGVIIHKIDRSARNLRDWAQLGELIDTGIELHFAHESLDLGSRGGRLSADIQAVVAADYIRNLRQEVMKGFYGRLKQGFYPLPAPRGYIDQGKAKAKTIDPIVGPLVRQAFDLYASGNHTLQTLRAEMFKRGLRAHSGNPLSLDATSTMLRNPFYIGLIRIYRTGQTFEGQHKPLVSKATFDRVQEVMSGRVFARPQKHAFPFRRMIKCAACGYSLIGERRKGHGYYRCHTQACRGTTLREQDIDRALSERISFLGFDEEEMREFSDLVHGARATHVEVIENQRVSLLRGLGKCEERLARLTDAFVDGLLDKETFEIRKASLFEERRSIRDVLENPRTPEAMGNELIKNLGQGNAAYLGYDDAFPEEKRDFVKELTSDLRARGKTLEIGLRSEFSVVAEWRKTQNGAPRRGAPRIPASNAHNAPTPLHQLYDELRQLAQGSDDPGKSPTSPSSVG